MAPKELSELTMFNRRKAHLLGQITRIRNSLENVDSPLNQVEIRTKLASLSEVKAKIDKLRTESYRILSDEELMDFETSLDTMEVGELILTSHCSATRGLLATDHVILNHGQVTWTTPELAPPLLTTTPHQREDVSALDRFNVHRCPTAGL
ncbi:uncharacterized protein TNCV_3399041 [Trichonephila clavipes]|nr:uncharacterized protein TNCV_3399041 [Trichonephila clavipes]